MSETNFIFRKKPPQALPQLVTNLLKFNPLLGIFAMGSLYNNRALQQTEVWLIQKHKMTSLFSGLIKRLLVCFLLQYWAFGQVECNQYVIKSIIRTKKHVHIYIGQHFMDKKCHLIPDHQIRKHIKSMGKPLNR